METYTPFASLLLAECLATDHFGTLHRGIDRSGHSAGRDVLVRRYHPHWLEAGLLRHPGDIRRNLIHLGHLKLFQGARLELEESPHFVWPLCQGKSLATVLEAARSQGIPFGLDPSLFLAWILCHHISQLHHAGLPLGFLTPHRIWVGFDGLVELLDTPVITQLKSLIESQPEASEAMHPYLQGPRCEGIAQDAYQVGALLFEMLSHRPLPQARQIASELGTLMVDGPDGPESLPASIREMLSRLLGLAKPFQSLEELEQELEEALFGSGEFNPSTFGLAFSMHTLFRFEIAAENQALEEERSGTKGLVAFEALQKGAPTSVAPEGNHKKPRRIFIPAAAVLMAITGLAAWNIHARQPLQSSASSAQVPTPKPSSENAPSKSTVTVQSTPTPKTENEIKPVRGDSPTPILPVNPVSVRLRVFVDEQGRVRQTFIVDGAAPGSHAETAALAAAREMHLAPAMDGGTAIRQWREITVRVK